VLSSVRYHLARRRVAGTGYRFEEVETCLCGTAGGTVVKRRNELGRELRLVQCDQCGLGRLSPRLVEDDLARYYAGDYRMLIRRTAHVDESYFERGIRRGRRVLEHLRERGALPAQGSPVIEIGTGAGGILEAFRAAGHPVAGSDLDPDCVAFAQSRGLDVVRGERLADGKLAPAGLIVLSHLVEHLPRPLESLAALEPWVDADTVLYVEVPGLKGGAPGEVPQIPHLFYYDKTTLEWLLGRAGWRLVDGDDEIHAICRPA